MDSLISKLKEISTKSNERAQRNIDNLIGRIEYFSNAGDEEKINECKGEAELWIGKHA